MIERHSWDELLKISRSERIPHAGSCGLLLKIMLSSLFKHEVTYHSLLTKSIDPRGNQ